MQSASPQVSTEEFPKWWFKTDSELGCFSNVALMQGIYGEKTLVNMICSELNLQETR